MKNLICACCGENAGQFEQWHNRDTGYGLCLRCRKWLFTRKVNDDEILRNYGVEGVNYAASN